MSELQKYGSFVLVYDPIALTFQVGTNARVFVFSEGASINQGGTLSGADNTVLAVFDSGSFAANDYAQISLSGTARLVKAVGTTSLTLGAGSDQSVNVGMRVLNIGTSSAKTASWATIYPIDQTTSLPITQPIRCDPNGNFEFFADTGDYDILVQNSAGTDLYIDQDVSIFTLGHNATGGTSGAGVVYLQNIADDFMVGGTTPGTAPFYVDSSAKTATAAGFSNVTYSLLGPGYVKAVHNTTPNLVLAVGATTLTLRATPTTNRIVTIPDATGTVALTTVANAMSGANTFSGTSTFTNTISTNAAITSTSTITTTNAADVGTLTTKHINPTNGTTIGTGNVAINGWGTGAAKAIDPTTVYTTTASPSKDTRMTIKVTAGTDSTTANPTVIVIFTEAYANAPHCVVVKNGDNNSTPYANAVTWTVAATALTIVYNGTPAANSIVTFEVFILG